MNSVNSVDALIHTFSEIFKDHFCNYLLFRFLRQIERMLGTFIGVSEKESFIYLKIKQKLK